MRLFTASVCGCASASSLLVTSLRDVCHRIPKGTSNDNYLSLKDECQTDALLCPSQFIENDMALTRDVSQIVGMWGETRQPELLLLRGLVICRFHSRRLCHRKERGRLPQSRGRKRGYAFGHDYAA